MFRMGNMNEDFIQEYGKDLFDEVFANIYGDENSSHITVKKNYTDKEHLNSEGLVFVGLNDGELVIQFRDGNWDGSVIEYYHFEN